MLEFALYVLSISNRGSIVDATVTALEGWLELQCERKRHIATLSVAAAVRNDADLGGHSDRLSQLYSSTPAMSYSFNDHDAPNQMTCKSGAVIDVASSIVLQRDSSGKPLQGFAVVQDVTERLRAEQASLNEQWALIIGYALDDLGTTTLHTWLDRLHPGDQGRA